LESLYIAFFPQYFSRDDFARLRTNLNGRWLNYWRRTDPIASPLFDAEEADEEIEDRWSYDPVKINRHSNYWSEPQQAAGV
jgi:hypothetical protein